jgi:hypothetical protein
MYTKGDGASGAVRYTWLIRSCRRTVTESPDSRTARGLGLEIID